MNQPQLLPPVKYSPLSKSRSSSGEPLADSSNSFYSIEHVPNDSSKIKAFLLNCPYKKVENEWFRFFIEKIFEDKKAV